jgi:uncharacterized cupin superfamily protein
MAIESSIKSGSESANFSPCPINPDWILEGKPVARIELLSSSVDGNANTFYWDCTAGRFNWFYSSDETLHILEGSVILKSPSGKVRRCVAGDTVFFPRGSSAEWTIEKYIRKLAFARAPLPGVLISAKRFRQRFKRLLGAPAGDEWSGALKSARL